MFLEIPDLLTAEEVAKLTGLAERAPFLDGRLSNPHAAQKKNVQIDINSAAHREASGLMNAALARTETFVNFAFPRVIAPPMLTKHEPGMAYGVHSDAAFMRIGDTQFRSDLSCTIFLSRPEAYEGGELSVHVGTRAVMFKLPPGGAIVYPSNTLHEVRPVRGGVRIVGITFIESRVADPAHREILNDLGEVAALEGLRMNWENRIRLGSVIQTLLRKWS